jgi:NAD(P)H-flavin reductase
MSTDVLHSAPPEPVLADPERVSAPGPMTPLRYRVVRHHDETHDTTTLVLEPVDDAIAAARPGQFTMLYAPGVGEIPISYSGGVDTREHIVHTIRAVGPVSKALSSLRAGAVVGVRGPYGSDWRVDAARGRSVIVVAGGIGLAPVRPAVEHFLANRSDYGTLSLVVGARSPRELLFPQLLGEWGGRFDIDVRVTVDAAGPRWHGHVGLVTQSLPTILVDAEDTVAMVCGPEVMMGLVAESLTERGLNAQDLLVSMERNMQCGVVQCGHCQLREQFLCREGPVLSYDVAAVLLSTREL